jgi:hypothetical protein
MPASVTFGSLRAFLEGLGFTLERSERRATFRHPSSAAIVLRPLTDADSVRPADLILVRHVLDDFGLMAEAEAERALHGLAHAG